MDKISIIIPCYNREEYIGRCLDSICSQTCSVDKLEIIVIDDDSKDRSCEIIKKYEVLYPNNILLVQCNENSGGCVGKVRNIGLSYATGNWIMFVDSDDVISPNMVEALLRYAKKYDADITCCGYIFEDENSVQKAQMEYDHLYCTCEQKEHSNLLLQEAMNQRVWGKLYKASFIFNNKIYFPEDKHIAEDAFFTLKCLLKAQRFYSSADLLYSYTTNSNGLWNSNNGIRYISEMLDVHEELLPLYLEERKLWKEFEWTFFALIHSIYNLCMASDMAIWEKRIAPRIKEIMKDYYCHIKENDYVKCSLEGLNMEFVGCFNALTRTEDAYACFSEEQLELKKGLIIAHSKMEVLNYFSDKIGDAAMGDGWDVYIIDIQNPETYMSDELDVFVKQHRCLAIFFNQIGTLLSDNCGENFWDINKVPVYSFQVDHPRNFSDAMVEPIEMLRVLSIDRNHINYIKRYFPKVKKCYFLPVGGEQECDEIKFLCDRKIDILYVGGCQEKVKEFPRLNCFKDAGADFYGNVISCLLDRPELTTEEAIENYFQSRNLTISDRELLNISTSISIFIETYVRREFKQKMLQVLDKRGLNIEIYGNGWENEAYSYGDNIRFHNRISSEECNAKIADAKITLNCVPWYKDGSSERPFNTMLNGSLCFIDTSDYLVERFTDEQNICFFNLKNPYELADKMEYYLSHIEEAQMIANKGYEQASQNDTWKNRFHAILKLEGEYFS